MPSKSFRYVIENAGAWASGSGPGYVEFVIATTDGQVPTSINLENGRRTFWNSDPAGTHNIDFNNSYVVHINGSPRNDGQKTTRGIYYFYFTDGQLENSTEVNPEVLRFSESCSLYFALMNNDWLLFDSVSNNLKYNSASYGSNPTVGTPVGSVKKLFRSESGMQSYIDDNLLNYEVKLQTLNANTIATTSDKSIYYGDYFGYTVIDSTILYSQFTTPSAGVTFDEIGYALGADANASGLSGSMTVQLHAVNMSTLRSNLSRTPEAQVVIPLSQLSRHRTTSIAKFIFGKLQSAVTLSGNTQHTVKATFSNVGTTSANGLRAGIVFNLNQYSQSALYHGANGPETLRNNAAFPFMLTTEIPPPPSNTAPTNITLSPSAIAENSPAGSTVGSFSAVDAEGGAMIYSLVAGAGASDNSSFVIEGNALKTAAGVSLDYENKSSYSIRVKATDSGGLQFEKQLSVSVTNVNEVPSVISLSAQSISESAPVNSTIGVLSAVDPEGNAISYSVVSGGDKFNISGNALRNSVALDYEAATSHVITIRATDSLGATKDESFTISVTDILTDNLFTVPAVTASTLNFRAFASTTDPKTGMVKLSDGSSLPVGSIVRFNGKRHMKAAGGAEAFVEITNVARPEWGWSQEGEEAWETLDSLGI